MSLYRGVTAPLLGNMVLLGIHFPTFSKTRKWLDEQASGCSACSPAQGCAGDPGPGPPRPWACAGYTAAHLRALLGSVVAAC